jgi:hypothetical protein
MTGYAVRSSHGVLFSSIDRSVKGGSIHLIMRAGQSGMAFFAGLGLPCLFGTEGVGGMAAITLVLNPVTAFAKSLPE